jgi:hypothetical protein
LFRQEDPLTDDIRQGVEETIDELKPQVGHPHMVGVGEDQADRDPPRPLLDDGPLLQGDKVPMAVSDSPHHRVILPCSVKIFHCYFS